MSRSPVVSLSSGTLHEWTRTQMLAKPSSNLLQRTGGNHRGGCMTWRTFTMTCLCWILGCMRLEIWRKIGLSGDWCLCTVLRTRSGACYYWIVCIKLTATMLHNVTYHMLRRTPSPAHTAHRAVMADTMQHGTAHASHQTAFRGDPEQVWSPGPHTRTACLFISTGNTRQPY